MCTLMSLHKQNEKIDYKQPQKIFEYIDTSYKFILDTVHP